MYRLWLCFLWLLPLAAHETICLNMIVKDEHRVIRRCLDSVKGLIDYWVIVDTGSTDGTQEIVREHLKGIPGELHERPWRNFGVNRSEAFSLAQGKGDYVLFMDADDVLAFDGEARFPPLTEDLYLMWRGSTDFSYQKPQLARGDLPWRWVGVTHEYLDCPVPFSSEILPHVRYVTGPGGASSFDPNKFLRNVALLKEGLAEEPDNARYMFYLAESLRDSGHLGEALEWYQKRVEQGGWREEVFWAKYQIGKLLHQMGLPPQVVKEAFEWAHEERPFRVEPVYALAELCNEIGEHTVAYRAIKAYRAQFPLRMRDSLFNEDWIDQYGLDVQLSIAAYYLGRHQEALAVCNQLLASPHLPEGWRSLVVRNATYPLAKLHSSHKLEDVYEMAR